MEGRNIPLWVSGMTESHFYYFRGKKQIIIKLPHFNVDHPFRVGKKSFVCYPYHIDIEDIEPLRLFLKKKDYELFILANSEYSSHTLKIIFLHKIDELSKLDFSEIENNVKDCKLYWRAQEIRKNKHKNI